MADTLIGLSPCGESGLKYIDLIGRQLADQSLPMRGEWIEIQEEAQILDLEVRLSPCGESGLKFQIREAVGVLASSLPMRGEWIEIILYTVISPTVTVSPHAGRVD